MYLSMDIKIKNKFHVQKSDLAFRADLKYCFSF